MSTKLYISSKSGSHAIVLVENNSVVEFNVEDTDDLGIVGNIYKGKVMNVVKGIQAAFVSIGREKNAYLYCGDNIVDNKEAEKSGHFVQTPLELQVGEEVMVQVAKTESGTKGARVTTNISIAGRYMVFMPKVTFIGISRKIEDVEKREKLENFVKSVQTEGGYVIRTNSEFATEEEILQDIEYLHKKWADIQERFKKAEPDEMVYKEGLMTERALRDLLTIKTEEIFVDNKDDFDTCVNFIDLISHKPIVTLFQSSNKDMFYEYGLSNAILNILDKKVVMESGAYLIIEHTEALTVIDVNTGKYVGNNNLQETVFETNIEAARKIANQLRLRNIGGIIIVDFIDMDSEKNKEMLLNVLEEELKKDRTKTNLVGMTNLGLVEITRTKSIKTISQKFSSPCPYCSGKGFVVKHEVLIGFIQTKLYNIFKSKNVRGTLVSVAPEVFDACIESRAFSLEISLYWKEKRIYITKDTSLNTQQYFIKKFNEDVFDLPEGSVLLT